MSKKKELRETIETEIEQDEVVEVVQDEQIETIEVPEVIEEAEVVDNEPVIYLGPTVYGVATKGTIYNNGLPKELTDAIEKKPIIGSLVVKISEANFVRAEIKKIGSAYNLFYNSIK